MSNIAHEKLNDDMSDVLESLGESPLSKEETAKIITEELKKLNTPSIKYKEKIDFNNNEELQEDFLLARDMIMETLDKSKKLSDFIFENLVVDTSNPLFLNMSLESTKVIQSNIQSLYKLYDSYHKIVGQKKRNTILDSSTDNKSSNNLPDGVFKGSIHKLKKENKSNN